MNAASESGPPVMWLLSFAVLWCLCWVCFQRLLGGARLTAFCKAWRGLVLCNSGQKKMSKQLEISTFKLNWMAGKSSIIGAMNRALPLAGHFE